VTSPALGASGASIVTPATDESPQRSALPVAAPVTAPEPLPPNGSSGSALNLLAKTVPATAVQQPRSNGRLWVEAEALLWWMKGANLPPLVTASPPGTPLTDVGVPATAGVSVLFGGSPVNGDLRAGARITAGIWLDCDHTCGVEAYFLQLGSQSQSFNGGSPGSLGRPFIDTATGLPNAQLVSLPGFLDGNVQAIAASQGLIGAGALGRCNLCCGSDCCCNYAYRLDALAGYRYLSLIDRVGISENLTSTDPTQTVAPLGTNLIVADSFHTNNQFYGADLGLTGEFRRNSWSLASTVRVALGATVERVDINGTTITTVPGLPSVVNSGGLLALSSNSGTHTRGAFAVVPEARIQLAYQVTPHVRVHVGYTILYWSQVARAGDQIDLVVNPALLPPPLPGASPLRPAFTFQGTGFWAQGVDLGMSFSF
jgi:hypothetical protein